MTHFPIKRNGGEQCAYCGATRAHWRQTNYPWYLKGKRQPTCPPGTLKKNPTPFEDVQLRKVLLADINSILKARGLPRLSGAMWTSTQNLMALLQDLRTKKNPYWGLSWLEEEKERPFFPRSITSKPRVRHTSLKIMRTKGTWLYDVTMTYDLRNEHGTVKLLHAGRKRPIAKADFASIAEGQRLYDILWKKALAATVEASK